MTKDLLFKDDIQQLVRDAYEPLQDPGGPGAHLYDEGQLERLPRGAREWALGVGNPVSHADLSPGDTVVDLGCGSGIDVLLAAFEVGPEGRSIGVDFLASMVERGQHLARQAAIPHATFIQSEIESVDLPDESADTVISNGAINLSARKSRVLAEAHRLVRPGGSLCVSDLVLSEEELPPEILTHPSAWAG